MWRMDNVGWWHLADPDEPACGTAVSMARAQSSNPPLSGRCEACLRLAQAEPTQEPKDDAFGKTSSGPATTQASEPRHSNGGPEDGKAIGTMEIDLAESYFARLRQQIAAWPSRYVLRTVIFCGEWPYSVDALSRLLPEPCYWYDQGDVSDGIAADTVVVGMWMPRRR